MAHNFTSMNVLKDLRMNISTRHISYLCEDKSLDKLKYQNLLQSNYLWTIFHIWSLFHVTCVIGFYLRTDHIKEYICLVHHQHKFSFAKTAEVLQRSVCSPKFNALKAAKAWLHLSTYANNLYSQPWRKEYQEIKVYLRNKRIYNFKICFLHSSFQPGLSHNLALNPCDLIALLGTS